MAERGVSVGPEQRGYLLRCRAELGRAGRAHDAREGDRSDEAEDGESQDQLEKRVAAVRPAIDW